MIKRLKRLRDMEISLVLKDDKFINPPREAQRNWLLNGAMAEFADNLSALGRLASRFVPGNEGMPLADRTQAHLSDHEIMEDWQIPLMRAMAEIVTKHSGSILEIGFGRGIASGFIQQFGCRSHTIIECNDSVIERFEAWREAYPDRELRMVPGLWQETLPTLEQFDGIFFHTYPLNETEFVEQIGQSATFAEHFFPHAAKHLHQGGIFTYLTNEIDSLSRSHQRLLFQYFSSIRIQLIEELKLPADVNDAWWADSMVVVEAVK